MWITEGVYAAYMESRSLANKRGDMGSHTLLGPLPRLTMSPAGLPTRDYTCWLLDQAICNTVGLYFGLKFGLSGMAQVQSKLSASVHRAGLFMKSAGSSLGRNIYFSWSQNNFMST